MTRIFSSAASLRGNIAVLRDAAVRRVHVAAWNWRGRKFYICHLAHENDRTTTHNIAACLKWTGVDVRVVEFGESGQRPELNECLDDRTIAVLGYNSQLDHSWIGEENFIAAAGRKNIPVIQWMLDHPSLHWPQFDNSPNAPNVRYLFVSDYCKSYFHRYGLPQAQTGVCSAGFNPLSRIDALSRQEFLARQIPCLIPLNLRRVGGTQDDLQARIASLQPDLQQVVREAIERARFDLSSPLEIHLENALAQKGLEIPHLSMHVCMSLVEDMTQIWRRRRIFEIASRFPVLVQTDHPPPELVANATAAFRNAPEWTNPKATLARLKECRAVLSVSPINDGWHDRTANAINAGCVPIVEDNVLHRRILTPDKTALFFRYDDDSLERCLDLVCNDPERAYAVADAAMPLRDDPDIRYAGWQNIIDLAINQF